MRTDERLATLDGIRAIAALLVPVIHLPVLFAGIHMPNAYLAVDLFFCLSGFVVARVYEKRLLTGHLSSGDFIFQRMLRFFPLYFVGLICGGLLAVVRMMHVGAPPWGMVAVMCVGLLQLSFIPAPFFSVLFPFNPPAWSLSLELFVNIAFAAEVRRLTPRVIGSILLVSFAAVVVFAMTRGLNRGYTWLSLPVGLSRALFSFSLGVLLCRFAGPARTRSNFIAWAVVAFIGLCLSIDVPATYAGFYAIVLLAVVFPATIYVGAHVEPYGLTRQVFVAGGSVSYGLYILHQPLGSAVEWLLMERADLGEAQIHIIAVCSMLLIVGVAFLLSAVVEPRMKRILGTRLVPVVRRSLP
jgi:peptidoglycan/LPS O-acetylase OafA/YrhL